MWGSQLGFSDAEDHYLKAELVHRLGKAIKSLGLTQGVAAQRVGATQPELSKILRGKFNEVSLERLMRFLTALGFDIEIKTTANKSSQKTRPLPERIADIAREATRLRGGKRGRRVKKREVDDLWGHA